MKNIILCLSILFLSACTQRLDPPAPILDQREEFFGPKPASKQSKQDKMLSRLIDRYGHGENMPAQEGDSQTQSGWAPATVTVENDQDNSQEDHLPEPLQEAPMPLHKSRSKDMSLKPTKPPVGNPFAPVETEKSRHAVAPAVAPLAAPVIASSPSKKVNTEEQDATTNLIWPVKGKIIKAYGPGKDGSSNDGINIEAREGSPVLAVAAGTVAYSTNKLSGFGNLVFIKHAGGLISVYAHLKDIHVVKGDKVDQGQTIGTVGKTGDVKTPQLHLELRKNQKTPDKKTGKKSVESFDPKTLLHD